MLEDYFDLQLRFAQHYATVSGLPFEASIERCTNLRRRMNLWGVAGADRWDAFLNVMRRAAADRSSALSACMELYESRLRLTQPRDFGCFSYDPPDQAGVLRMHFMPVQGMGNSPLALDNQCDRMDELRALFLHVRQVEAGATSVRGISWLYNLDAYKRLFPPAYGASAQLPTFPLNMTGSSTWGQVLNWRQEVKPATRDAVLANLTRLDIGSPWEVFPLRARVASCEIHHFHDRFA